MMKICHITSVHKSTDVRIFEKECVSLAAAGYDVYLVAQGESREEKGVHVTGVGKAPKSRLKRMTIFVRKVYKKALELDADIYHFHDPEFLPYGVKLKKRGKKVIYDVHEDYPLNILDKQWILSFLRKPVSKLYVSIENKSLKHIDAIVTVTPQIVKRYSKRIDTVALVTNYPILDENVVISKTDKSNRFCFAGTLEHFRRIDNIIDVISDIDIKFDLAGSVSGKFYKIITKSKGWNKVKFYGSIPYKQVLALYDEALFGIMIMGYHPKIYGKEGSLGVTKLFEYMRHGLPIICSDHIIYKKIIEKYKCGICINPDSKEDLIDAIKFMINHKNKAREMGLNGHKAYLEQFNWSTQEKKLLDLYATVSKTNVQC